MAEITVIGDSCQDVFIYCETSRLAPDVPVPVLQQLYKESNPGMAANVARNIKSKINRCNLITNQNWESILKTRFVHEKSNHMFFRLDFSPATNNYKFKKSDLEADIVVISDYNKGFLKEQDIYDICTNHPNVFLDTKKILGSWAENALYIKINDFEFENSKNFMTEKISKKIIHTRGPKGCDFQGKNYPVEECKIRDTSGAGDSFMAALVYEYSKTSNIVLSIAEANRAASKVVRTRGVGII
jgi:bifunctional ADP-heptose synthase (sugar kinase/adenylyltransferase)